MKAAMQLLAELKDPPPTLENCKGTLAMIEKFNDLIDIMNSKTSMNALWHKKNDASSNITGEAAVECRYKRDKIQVGCMCVFHKSKDKQTIILLFMSCF